MLMKMAFMTVMHMTIVQVIDVPGMLDRLMAAIRTMRMICMIRVDNVMSQGTGRCKRQESRDQIYCLHIASPKERYSGTARLRRSGEPDFVIAPYTPFVQRN